MYAMGMSKSSSGNTRLVPVFTLRHASLMAGVPHKEFHENNSMHPVHNRRKWEYTSLWNSVPSTPKEVVKYAKYVIEQYWMGGVETPMKVMGSGAFGTVITAPTKLVRSIQGNPVEFGLTNWIKGQGRAARDPAQLAVKFQVVRRPSELEEAIRESTTHAVLWMSQHKTSRGIPPIKRFIPAFYGAGYYPRFNLFVQFMEIVDGLPLSRYLAFKDVPRSILTELEQALCSLWNRGFFHSDAHFNNIMVTRAQNGTPRVKILDFGQTIVLPKQLRPSSLAAVRDAKYLEKLEAYAVRAKVTWRFFNPNTRLLKAASYYVNRSRSTSPSSRSRSRSASRNTTAKASPNSGRSSSGIQTRAKKLGKLAMRALRKIRPQS